jgi:hypothetical protein
MKKLVLAALLTIFAFSNFGSISDTSSKEIKTHSCPFMQQIKTSGECPYNQIDESKKSGECPFLNSMKSGCPYLKGDVKESESKTCPYQGKKKSVESDSNKKVKTLDIKFS